MIELVENALDAILPVGNVQPEALSQAMRWAVMGGGKRIRPQICLMAAVAAGGQMQDAVFPACAIELLHSYTLVHDDLPSMDNDSMRRGKPSVWAKFGEATAVLAGDGLQAIAFGAAARTPRNAVAVVAALANAAKAVVEGQVDDLAALNDLKDPNAIKGLEGIFERKTAALFASAAEMGALSAGATQTTVERLRKYGHELGMAFQYRDDLLDGGDGAFSSLSLLGRDEVEHCVAEHTSSAVAMLTNMPGDAEPLAAIAKSLSERIH